MEAVGVRSRGRLAFSVALTLAACGGTSEHSDGGGGHSGATGGSGAGAMGGATSGAGGSHAGSAGNGSGGTGTGGRMNAGGLGGAGRAGLAGDAGRASAGVSGSAAGSAGTGGVSGGEAGEAGSVAEGGSSAESGAGGSSSCDAEVTMSPRRSASSGFAGTEARYSELYDIVCALPSDCLAPCLERGGTQAMCDANECVSSPEPHCLPTPIWLRKTVVLTGPENPFDATELVLIDRPFHDVLLLDDFGFILPTNAEVLGITVNVHRGGSGANDAVDGSVRLLKDGVPSTDDRATATPWSYPDFASVAYGGPSDLWGETWTAADLNSERFGVALSALYPQTNGNGRAYVDGVSVTVSFRLCP